MNYADLFRVTLPETILEIAALLVLIVDLGFLRKSTHRRARRCRAAGRSRVHRAYWTMYLQPVAGLRLSNGDLLLRPSAHPAWRRPQFSSSPR